MLGDVGMVSQIKVSCNSALDLGCNKICCITINMEDNVAGMVARQQQWRGIRATTFSGMLAQLVGLCSERSGVDSRSSGMVAGVILLAW